MGTENLPTHIAIILDGNRRWAKSIGKRISYGHKVGADKLEEIAKYANNIGIKYLTVYAFSTENWKRDKVEVDTLMNLLQTFIDKFIKLENNENIKIKVIGEPGLPQKLQSKIVQIEEKSKDNTGLLLCLAINYGGRQEIVNASKSIATSVKNGIIDIKDINEDIFERNLYTYGVPPVDLLIRTSGEQRTSNFLPWQLAYAEFIFIEKHWPEFETEDLLKTITEYNNRNRRFGGN